MTTPLQNALKKLDEVKATTDVAQELANPIQKVLDLVKNDTLTSLRMTIRSDDSITSPKPKSVIIVVAIKEIDGKDYSVVLGAERGLPFTSMTSERTAKLFSAAAKKQMMEINDHLSGINMLMGDSIPADKTMYFYSKARAQNLNGFAKELPDADWPMVPKYLEGLVDTSITKDKKLEM